ncbi:MAG: hypothetical protein D6806_04235 [Deltaproteobacteria bacterium]|nr:MAG: hypothetical protein D6806_04235 [Deltaproteobacteria bacterium]
MIIALAIGIPLFLVLGGALLALAFHGEEEEQRLTLAVRDRRGEVKSEPVMLVTPAKISARQPTLDELVAELEDHLKQELAQAERFANRPSAETLDARNVH